MLIGGLQKTSLIDYPENISAIIFTKGCNFKCPYCHNPELFENKRETEDFSVSRVIEFLKKRKGKLDGVVITGGEPTLHKDLPLVIKQIKDLGFKVKLDTNGTNFKMLNSLINNSLIDYVAMDIKAPIEKYEKIVDCKVEKNIILKSIELLKNDLIPYEFRTTVVKSQLTFEDFENIGKMIKSSSKYYLQKFLPTKTLNQNFMNEKTYSDKEFCIITKILKNYVENVFIR